ncbi:PKD domain-containing protein [Pedobacter gandavensis]|uniref:PKD domain-containing protein n=1 Tax=Pedobacter gandavensis TaxID=2679963 RepID=UPI00292F60CB|nr:PKD domain-containing protein [Pedobacter gandavensis]
MKKLPLILLLSAGLFSCKKEIAQPLPTAEFSFNKDLEQHPFPLGISIPLTNNATNAVSYLWDLGYGKTSTEKEPKFEAEKPGTYTVSLSVKNADGKIATSKKEVKVLQLLSGKITLERLNLDHINMDKADVWLEISEINNRTYTTLPDGTIPGKLIFKSPVLNDLTNNSKNIPIPLSEPLKFNWSTILVTKDLGYLYSLFSYKNNEKILIFSTRSSGGSTSYWGNIKTNSFEIGVDLLTSRLVINGYFN